MKGIILFVVISSRLMAFEGDSAYLRGEAEQNLKMKQESFNEALKLYGSYMNSQFGNGKLYYNAANTFYELGQYPYALLYYYKALQLRPNDENVRANLQIVREEMGLPTLEAEAPLLSLPLRLQLFAFFCIFFFLFWSLSLWFPSRYLKAAAYFSLIFCVLFLLSALYSNFFSPIEGIIVRASKFYKVPGEKTEDILFSGSKVNILDVVDNGEWLKILTEEGNLGYVSSHSIKII